jgi:A118 family predicted phage portal protein
LNQTKKYDLPTEYYANIQIWRDWWKGFYKPFHEFIEINGDTHRIRKLFTLKMAKKVCEDWASILLNEKTEIVIDDKTSSVFVVGSEDDQDMGGVLGDNDFWEQGNALVEKAFMSGTGAFVLKLSGMVVDGETIVRNANTKIRIDYLTAQQIIPITVRQGKIIDVAFASEVTEKGKQFVYLETHELTPQGYKITNEYFNAQNDQLSLASLPSGIVPVLNTGSSIPLFSIFGPNIVNTFDKANNLGMSIYAHAIDNLMGVDLAFNNLNRDFKLGGKKVFYNQSLTHVDAEGNIVTPDDVMQQLFVQVGDALVDENGKQMAVQEFNPELRVQENKEGIQSQLDYLSFKCGLGTKHYQFNAGSVVTATQYMGDKQELIQNAAKHYIVIERSLKALVRAILWAGKEILGQSVDPEATVTINFEDSYIIDKESERLRDLQEIRDGIMQKYEYRVKWYGEDEATAKKMIAQQLSNDELMGFRGGSNE